MRNKSIFEKTEEGKANDVDIEIELVKPDVKTGYKTTEFWVTIWIALITMVFSVGVIDESVRDALFSMAAGVATVIVYILSRTWAKS